MMIDEIEEEPAAIMGSTVRCQTMADASLRIVIDVSPMDMQPAFRLFGTPGVGVALARVTNEVAQKHDQPKPEKKWGQEAMALYQSSFFRTPEVWRAIDTDKQYLEWIKRQPCAIKGDYSEWAEDGEGFSIPAHVRRVEHGSGTAIKPEYSAIPLTNELHQEAHKHGDSCVGSEEWWDKQRIKYVHLWCWETAKKQIQSENPDMELSSFGYIHPRLVEGWALRHDIHRFLPNVYKGHIQHGESEAESEA